MVRWPQIEMRDGNMILIFIVGILLGLIVWNRKALWATYQRRKKEIQRKKPFQYEYQMGESTIAAIGNKNEFSIVKDNELTFHVVDGQIVSVSDGTKTYTYGVN